MSSLSVKLSFPTRVQPEVMPQPGMAGVYTNQMHYFKKHLLDELGKKKFATDFMNPVDTEELQIPNYYSVIHRPMDVGTITKRVENNYYRDVSEAIADFQLIIRNCYLFNHTDTVVYRKGVQLEKFFLRVIKNIPTGEPVPCNKDPMATCKLKANPMAGPVEQECHNQLQRLYEFTSQAEATARNFFFSKWNSFAAKVDKQFFKSTEEFRSQVDGLFKRYHDQAKMIYEKAYDQPGGFEGNGSTSISISHTDRDTPASSICLSDSEVSDLLQAVQSTQNALNQCLKQPQKFKSLAETFSATLAQFKLKLEAIKSAMPAQNSENNGENPSIVEEKQVSASQYLPTEGLDFLVDTPDAGLSDDDPKLDPIPMEERRSIQMQFGTLPTWAMREICAIVHSNETLDLNSAGGLTFDLNFFELPNAHIMKAAVARALKLNNKVNLRDMQPKEKEDLRCSLQSQLTNLNECLNQNSRRKNAAPPPASDKKPNNSNKNDSEKRGKKRPNSEDPRPKTGTSEGGETKKRACTPPRPQTPIQTIVTQASKKSKKSKKVVQKVPPTPKGKSQIVRASIKIPRTPGRLLPATRIFKTPLKRIMDKYRQYRYKTPAKTPAKSHKQVKKGKKVKKVKTLADPSSDEEEHDEKDNEKPCSSTRPKAKKGKKKNKKGKNRPMLTPGNVLNADLSISSSNNSDED